MVLNIVFSNRSTNSALTELKKVNDQYVIFRVVVTFMTEEKEKYFGTGQVFFAQRRYACSPTVL